MLLAQRFPTLLAGDSMKVASTEQIRALDRRTIAAGAPGETLMERAGYAVAKRAVDFLKHRDSRAALLFAGKGNNGGDAFVAARHLAAAGCEPTLVLVAGRAELQGDARTHFERMIGVKLIEWVHPGDLAALADLAPGVIIDGLLGTGLTGDVREPIAGVIHWINAQRVPVIAIDIPSGLDSDTGAVHGVCLRAALTVTMGLPKLGLLQPAAADYVGQLEVVDIGFPAAFVAELETDVELISTADVAPLLPPRPRGAHKGTFGHLLIVAGSEGYTGAPVLCAQAAARSGTGLVTLAVPRAIYPIVAAQCPPEVMPRPFAELDYSVYDAIAVGPGLGRGDDLAGWLFPLIRGSGKPLVIDADALNVLAGHLDVIHGVRAVLTPHPGEMGRLIGSNAPAVQAARWETARAFVREQAITLVLKGAGTVVAEKTCPLWINATGNPGMAKGGMGDALTGIVGALLAQGLSPFDAARLGVYVHGRAGDLAAERPGPVAMLASDLIACLGAAFGELTP